MLVLLVLVAFATLFIRMPRWLAVLLTFAFVGIGSLMILFGWMGSYWDSHMQPGADSPGSSILIAGILLLLSRAASVFKLIMEILVAPSSR